MKTEWKRVRIPHITQNINNDSRTVHRRDRVWLIQSVAFICIKKFWGGYPSSDFPCDLMRNLDRFLADFNKSGAATRALPKNCSEQLSQRIKH